MASTDDDTATENKYKDLLLKMNQQSLRRIVFILSHTPSFLQCKYLTTVHQCIEFMAVGAPILHQHAAFGPVLSNSGGMLVNLSPGWLLGDPLEASTGASALELGPMDAGHGRQGRDVEYVANAVLRILGRALCVGHGADLPRQATALQHRQAANDQNREPVCTVAVSAALNVGWLSSCSPVLQQHRLCSLGCLLKWEKRTLRSNIDLVHSSSSL